MATLYKVTGTSEIVQPKNTKDFQLEELYALLQCEMIEIVYLNHGEIMIIDEEGKLRPNSINEEATKIFQNATSNPDVIVGNALVCNSKQLK